MFAYRVQNLVKVYPRNDTPANNDITFDVREGEIFGLLGDNGGGKSTLVRQMVGLLESSSGSIELFGESIDRNRQRLGLLVGFMPQQSEGLNRLTVAEALFLTAHLRGMNRTRAERERDLLLEQFGLHNLRDRDNALLSRGQRRLVRLAVAMAGSPPVLVLDEPTNDLDPLRRRAVWERLRELNMKKGVTIIFVTHDAIEAEKMVQRIAILKDGRIAGIGKPDELKKQLSRDLRIELKFNPENAPVARPGFRFEVRRPDHWVFFADWSETVKLLESLRDDQLESIRVHSPTLEDLYVHYVAEP
jgi:ABC-type multidrug transport system ATPase subunit